MIRNCSNCKHRDLPYSNVICHKCMWYGGYDNWEPIE